MKLAQVSVQKRETIALALVVIASIAGAWLAGKQAAHTAATTAAQTVRREGAKYSYKIALELHKNQIKGCHRNNNLRAESNARIPAHKADTKGLLDFLKAAEKARLAEGTPTSIAAAKQYVKIQADVLSHAIFHKQKLVDCDKLYPSPEKPDFSSAKLNQSSAKAT